MTTNAHDMAKSRSTEGSGTPLTWVVTVLACAYIVWTGTALYLSMPIFINMLNSMGVDLALSTRIVLASYRVLYPVLFGGGVALLIAKQFFVREKWVNISVTLAAVVVLNIISNAIVAALYRPLFDLIEKLNK